MADAVQLASRMASMIIDEESATADARKWVVIGMIVLVVTFGGAVIWSSLAPLSSAVVATGSVKVDSSRKKVQHPEGGLIKDILVRDGSRVQAGDILVRLDETRAGAAHGVVIGGRELAAATQARLEAERDERPRVEFPGFLLERAKGQPQVAQTLAAQESQFTARRVARIGELAILDQQIAALRNEIAGIESQRLAKHDQLESLERDLQGLVKLDAEGMVEKTRLRALERDIARVRGEREELVSRMAATRTAISEKELKKFQVRKAFQEEVAAELKRVQAENFELLERESATRRTLELTELRAPVSGTVTDLKVHTAGGVVSPGEVLMEIVPSDDKLVVEARVLPNDIDRIAVGQDSGLKLQAFNQRSTPELNGKVTYVAADAVTDPRTGLSYFVVKVDVGPSELARLDGLRVQPGMQADLFIRTGERTFLSYLVQPLADSMHKAWRER